jgi:hypothetical protein
VIARVVGRARHEGRRVLAAGLRALPVSQVSRLPQRYQVLRLRPGSPPRPSAAALRTWCGFIERTRLVPGGIAELGVRAADRLILATLWARRHGIDKPFFGFDSFSGYPKASERDPASWRAEEQTTARLLAERERVTRPPDGWIDDDLFHTTVYPKVEWVRRRVAQYGASDVTLFEGWFEDTLPAFKEPLSLAVNDSDLFESTTTVLRYLWPLVQPGGIVVNAVHGTHPGARAAFEAFCATGAPAIQSLAIPDHKGMAYVVKPPDPVPSA